MHFYLHIKKIQTHGDAQVSRNPAPLDSPLSSSIYHISSYQLAFLRGFGGGVGRTGLNQPPPSPQPTRGSYRIGYICFSLLLAVSFALINLFPLFFKFQSSLTLFFLSHIYETNGAGILRGGGGGMFR